MPVIPCKILPGQRSVTEVVNHLVSDIVSRAVTRSLCALVLGAAVFATPVAQASDDDGAVATIQAATVKQVLQDEVRVTFSTQATGTTAPEVNRKLAAALDGARDGFQIPDGVEVSTGNFSVFLDYGKDNQPKGWTGRASLAVVSTNLDEASTVIEHFGKSLAVSSLRFSLSREARQAY
ncbi:MAG TPA: SIMPL domain-containing protein, partial [Orrella sp.]